MSTTTERYPRTYKGRNCDYPSDKAGIDNTNYPIRYKDRLCDSDEM